MHPDPVEMSMESVTNSVDDPGFVLVTLSPVELTWTRRLFRVLLLLIDFVAIYTLTLMVLIYTFILLLPEGIAWTWLFFILLYTSFMWDTNFHRWRQLNTNMFWNIKVYIAVVVILADNFVWSSSGWTGQVAHWPYSTPGTLGLDQWLQSRFSIPAVSMATENLPAVWPTWSYDSIRR